LPTQVRRGAFSFTPAFADLLTDKDARIKKRPCGDDQGTASDKSVTRVQPGNLSGLDLESPGFCDENLHATLGNEILDSPPVQFPICLNARPLNCGALAPVEHPAVDRGAISRAGH
jgi:hypothetical protein